jgi:DNA-binding SARP family transcriptional activator
MNIELRILGPVELEDSEGRRLHSVLAHPKRVALLAFLGLPEPGNFRSRASATALLWPDLDEERGRAQLRKAIHHLRVSLGEWRIVRRGEEELGLADGAIWCDAWEFQRRIRSGRVSDAMGLYRGDLLHGFHVPECREFDGWLEGERWRLRDVAARGARTLAQESETAGESDAAVSWSRLALALSQDDERRLRDLIGLLDRVGSGSVALREFRGWRDRVLLDLGIAPSPETAALVQRIRDRTSSALGQLELRPSSDPDSRRRPAGFGLDLDQEMVDGAAASRPTSPAGLIDGLVARTGQLVLRVEALRQELAGLIEDLGRVSGSLTEGKDDGPRGAPHD